MRGHAKRLIGFSVLPALSLLASVILLPLISRSYGATGWATLALGQSVGAITSVVVGLAWPIIGGNQIALATGATERRTIYRISVYSRLALLIVVFPLAVAIVLAFSTSYSWEAVLFMTGIAFNGLSASWYFSGTGTPKYLIVNEGLTRMAAYLLSAVGLLGGLGLWWYAGVMAFSGLVMAALNWARIMGREPLWVADSWAAAKSAIRSQLVGTVSRLGQAAFSYGGVTLVAIFAHGSLGTFAAADQLQKAANNALAVVPMSFVSWVGQPGRGRAKRSGYVLLFIAALCIAVLIVWLAIAPLVVTFLFSGGVRLSATETLLVGLIVIFFLFARSAELLALVPAGKTPLIYKVNNCTSLAGVALIVAGAVAYGTVGALAATLMVPVAQSLFYVSHIGWGTRRA